MQIRGYSIRTYTSLCGFIYLQLVNFSSARESNSPRTCDNARGLTATAADRTDDDYGPRADDETLQFQIEMEISNLARKFAITFG